MREIKFRAWDKRKSRMMYDGIILDMSDCSRHDMKHNFDASDSIELMQYTGLKDKNGVEIYEGDIVKVDEEFFARVLYNERFTSFDVATTGNTVGFYDYGKSLEVIGNIYENPELLENK